MADTVADVTEKVLGTPEKEVVEKKVVEEVEDVEDVDDEDSKPSENGKEAEVKLNGSSSEGNGVAEKNGDGDAPKNGVSKESDIVASKRKSGAGDATDGVITEGASPEKKAKLAADEPVEVEANGEAEVVA